MSTQPDETAPTPAEAKERLEQALFEIRRVIAGPGRDARARARLPARAGAPADRGRARAREDAHDQDDGERPRRHVRARAVHARTSSRRTSSARASTAPTQGSFDTELGPVFCNFLLADEINRAPAKVQSALLEVMQEHQVTIAHTTYPVPDPFLVMATQNPIESEGTYPLPEAQVDRFMLKVLIGYPEHDEELTIVQRQLDGAARAAQALSLDELTALQRAVFDGLRRPAAHQLRRRRRDRDARARRGGLAGARDVHRVRRQPARADQPRAGRARARAHPRPRLRARRGPQALAKDALRHRLVLTLPGARGGGEPRRDPRQRARRRSRPADRPRRGRAPRDDVAPARARTDARASRPRADAGRAAARARRRRSAGASRACSPATTARRCSARAPSSPRCGRTSRRRRRGGSTGTSRRARASRTCACSSPSACSSRGSCSTRRPRCSSARPTGARRTSRRASRSRSVTSRRGAGTGSGS